MKIKLWLFSYNSIKTWMQEGDSTKSIGPMNHMMAASEAGMYGIVFIVKLTCDERDIVVSNVNRCMCVCVCVCLLVHPLEFVQTRISIFMEGI